MRPALLAALVLAAACKKDAPAPATPEAAQPTSTQRGFVFRELKPDDGELKKVLAGELERARARGLKPFVYVGATWCGPCLALRKSLSDPQMIDAFKGTYIVHLDLDAWSPALEAAGFKSDSVPVFFAVDAQGRPGRSLDGGAWGEDVPANMAPPLKKFFAAAGS